MLKRMSQYLRKEYRELFSAQPPPFIIPSSIGTSSDNPPLMTTSLHTFEQLFDDIHK